MPAFLDCQGETTEIPSMQGVEIATIVREIRSERQVVYILVEARKLLEQQGTLESFRGFKLCGDWAVRPKLRGPDAQMRGSVRDFV